MLSKIPLLCPDAYKDATMQDRVSQACPEAMDHCVPIRTVNSLIQIWASLVMAQCLQEHFVRL